jgi:acyl carrier protein
MMKEANDIVKWDDLFGPEVEPEYQKEFIAPKNPVEEQLARIWADLLNFDKISADDNFLELGGHSLLAIQLLQKIKDGFKVELSLKDMITQQITVKILAEKIEGLILEEANPQEVEQMLKDLEGKSDQEIKELLAKLS